MVKPLEKSLIIISILLSLAFQSYSQVDTSKIKKEIQAVLKKNGLQNSQFEISVKSINQKGGQTAFIINNNYFGDTTKHILNKDNLEYRFDNFEDRWSMLVNPKEGSWQSPFTAYPDTFYNQIVGSVMYIPNGSSMNSMGEHVEWTIEGKKYLCRMDICSSPCTKTRFGVIPILKNKECIFLFGDYADNTKWYLYKNGIIMYIPPTKK